MTKRVSGKPTLPYISPTSPLHLTYLPQVEDVLRKHIHPLRECYQHYLRPEHYQLDDELARGDRTSGGRDATSRGGDRLCLEGWIAMLVDADLLDSCLTRQAAAHAFVSSQMLVTDEVRMSPLYLAYISPAYRLHLASGEAARQAADSPLRELPRGPRQAHARQV